MRECSYCFASCTQARMPKRGQSRTIYVIFNWPTRTRAGGGMRARE